MVAIPRYKFRLVEDGFNEYPHEFISNADQAADLFMELLKDLPHEEVVAMYISGTNQVLGTATIAMGGLHGAALTPRDVFRGAIGIGASAIILAHNHPSGNPMPSKEDIEMTKSLIEVGNIIGIGILDHLVIAGKRYNSVMEKI